MKMSSIDDGQVLQIIHPGGLIEVYNRPMKAKEIMKKHPKVCIARTDVFKTPWFVVDPEATLTPGMKFLLVPMHTLKKLLVKNGYNTMNSPIVTNPSHVMERPSTRFWATVHPQLHQVISEVSHDGEEAHPKHDRGRKILEERSSSWPPKSDSRVHECDSKKKSKALKMVCGCLAPQGMAKPKVCSRKSKRTRKLHSPNNIQLGHTEKVDFFPSIHEHDEIPVCNLSAPKPNRTVRFRSPTEEDIYYISTSCESTDRDSCTS